MLDWECTNCGDDIWVCQEDGTPDCDDVPVRTMVRAKEKCPDGWCEADCIEITDPGTYYVWYSPKNSDDNGKCDAALRKQSGSPDPSDNTWVEVGTKDLIAGRYKLYCKRGSK